MVKVTVNGVTIAESNQTVVVEGNHYFPPDSVTKSLFSNSKTRCDPLFRLSWFLSHFLTFRVQQHRLPVERVRAVRSPPYHL